jgi:hypothetical protein
VQVDKLVRTLSGGFDDELKEEQEAALLAQKGQKKKKKKVVDDSDDDEEYVDYTKMTLEEQANYEAEKAEREAAAKAAAPGNQCFRKLPKNWRMANRFQKFT